MKNCSSVSMCENLAYQYFRYIILRKKNSIKLLQLNKCPGIKDFTPISYLERLEELSFLYEDLPNILFLLKNNNIKKLEINYCNYKNEDFSLYQI